MYGQRERLRWYRNYLVQGLLTESREEKIMSEDKNQNNQTIGCGCAQGEQEMGQGAPCENECADTHCTDEGCACHPPLPKPTFTTFVMSLASSALVQLGEVPEPESGTMQEELEHAKYTIDILSMIHDKVTNGMDDDERRLIDGLLFELRMKYVAKKP